MITFLMFLLFNFIIWSINLFNPVKMTMMLSFVSFILFYFLFVYSSVSWICTLFYILFMGGVLVMFMIVSVFLPNNKSYSSKFLNTFILSLIFFIFSKTLNFSVLENFLNLSKHFYNTNFLMFFLVNLILIYFICFILIISENKMTMRTFFCYKKKLIL